MSTSLRVPSFYRGLIHALILVAPFWALIGWAATQ